VAQLIDGEPLKEFDDARNAIIDRFSDVPGVNQLFPDKLEGKRPKVGNPTRIRIGGYPDTSIDEARKEAQKFTGEIVKGGNPHQARRIKNDATTLEELFNYWLDSYAKVHKKAITTRKWNFTRKTTHERWGVFVVNSRTRS